MASRDPHLWVLTELYYPEDTSTGHYLTGIAEGLASENRVHVLCSQPTYSRRGMRAAWKEARGGVVIERIRSTTFPKDNLPLRLVNLVTFVGGAFLRSLRRIRKGDIVLAVTNPPVLPHAAALAARLRGARFWLLVHDIYPDVLVRAGVGRSGSPLIRIADRMTHWLYSESEVVIALGEGMQQQIREKLKSRPERVTIIPNWADLDRVKPQPRSDNALLRSLGLSSKFVVQYMGNMGRTHDIEGLAEAARLLRDDDRIHFLVIGWGAKKEWLERTVRTTGAKNITILPPCSREDLSTYLNAADVCVVTFNAGMGGISVPSRMYNIFAAGKPILAVSDPDRELAEMIRREKIGLVVTPGRPDELAATVRQCLSERTELEQMGRRARNYVEAGFSREHVEERYRRLVRTTEARAVD